jgi:hypothetical protein
MSVAVSLSELLEACEWVSSGEAAGLDAEARISRETGSIHWRGEGVDEEPPDDIDDDSLYVAVPPKSEFDLGRSLALQFAQEHLPRSLETVSGFFRKRGAYSHFKALLANAGQLDAWHRYEAAATESALREWCESNGFELMAPGQAG